MPLVSFDTLRKTSEKPLVFLCFQRVLKEVSGMKCVQETKGEGYSQVKDRYLIILS